MARVSLSTIVIFTVGVGLWCGCVPSANTNQQPQVTCKAACLNGAASVVLDQTFDSPTACQAGLVQACSAQGFTPNTCICN